MSHAPAGERLMALKKARLLWAREVLEIPADAKPEHVRRLLLRGLSEADFVPSAERQQAIETLLGSKSRPAGAGCEEDAFLRALEGRLRGDVERFAAKFFDLPVPERRARYARLGAACGFSPLLRVRLRGLEPGLKINPSVVAGESPPVRRLVEHLCRLLVLRPSDRASLRRELHREMSETMPFWNKAARRLRAGYPELAAMDADFVARLAEWSPRPVRAAPASAADLEERREAAAVSRARSYRDYEAGSGFPWYVAVIAVVLALKVAIRGCDRPSRTSPQPPSPPYYRDLPRDVDPERVREGMEILRRLQEKQKKSTFDPKAEDEFERLFQPVDEEGRVKPSVFPRPPRADEWKGPPSGGGPTPRSPPRQPRLPDEGLP